MRSQDRPNHIGMTDTEKILFSMLGVLLFGLMTWTLVTTVESASRVALLTQRNSMQDLEFEQIRKEMREHRSLTERRSNGEGTTGGMP